jgi:hypothetical protein
MELPSQRELNDVEGQVFKWPYDSVLAQPFPPSPVSKLDRRHTGRLRKRDNLLTREIKGVGRGADSCDRKKAWSSINHSILSVLC